MKITYKFADGTVSEVEVSDELYAAHEEMVKLEKSNHRKNTRRHISLSRFGINGDMDIEDKSIQDPLDNMIADEEKAATYRAVHQALEKLTGKQRKLAIALFFDGMTQTQFARQEQVSASAISSRYATIKKKLRKLLGKP